VADKRQPDAAEGPHVTEVILKMVDRLETSIDRLQQTVREDFATQGEVEHVKLAVQQIRKDVDAIQAALKDIETARQTKAATLSETDRRLVVWFLWVAIPAGAGTLVKVAWDFVISPWLKGGAPKP
jgi:multidrug resistance efflux pump